MGVLSTGDRTIGSIPTFKASDDGRLSEAEVAAFEAAGVVIIEDFVAQADCRRLQQRARELVDAFDPESVRTVFSTTKQTQLNDEYFYDSGDKIRFFFEDGAFDEEGNLRQSKHESLNKMGHAMHDLDPVFDAFSRTPELAEVAKRIGFVDPVILQSMYIFKPPRIGGEVVCHQDSTYIYTQPESCVGFWFALEDATLENGCMQFIPGGHAAPLRRRNYRRPDGTLVTVTLDDTPWPTDSLVPIEAETGALVVFDGRSPHFSAANRSLKSRHAYTLHVVDRTCHYPVENWLQRGPDLPLRGFDGKN